ncbi:nucleoporin NUP188-like, partial [Saccoglossus kowalevskii]
GCIMCLNDDPTKEVILDNIISALKTQVANDTMSLFNLKSGSLLSSLYLSLLKHWSSCHYQQWHKLIDLVWTLEKMVFGRNQVINRIQSTLLAAISVLLQYNRDVKITQQISNSLVGRLFPLVCLAIQQSSTLYCQQPTDITDRLEDQKKISSHNKKHTLPIIGVCLLDELVSGPVDTWLPLLRQHSILPLLITTLQSCIVKKQGLYYVEAVMNLLLNLSQIQQAAEAVSNCGLTQHTCITFTATYQKNTEGEINGHVTIKEQSEPVTWLSVYRQSLTLMASMLATLKHSFLTDALNFFGVHQDRITQCLSVVK